MYHPSQNSTHPTLHQLLSDLRIHTYIHGCHLISQTGTLRSTWILSRLPLILLSLLAGFLGVRFWSLRYLRKRYLKGGGWRSPILPALPFLLFPCPAFTLIVPPFSSFPPFPPIPSPSHRGAFLSHSKTSFVTYITYFRDQ